MCLTLRIIKIKISINLLFKIMMMMMMMMMIKLEDDGKVWPKVGQKESGKSPCERDHPKY